MQAIIGAMDEEVSGYISELKNYKTVDWNAGKFHTGNIGNHEVVVVKCGVGKVQAAMITQKLIDSFDIKHILFTGIAGSLNPAFNIGDIIIATDTVQHDIDASGLGIPRGHIPYTDIFNVICDPYSVPVLFEICTKYAKTHKGRILTGDVFLTEKDSKHFEYLHSELNGDAVEMEGASVGTVAFKNGIPFNLVRIISDKADGEAPKNFKDFLHKASETCWRIVETYMNMKSE